MKNYLKALLNDAIHVFVNYFIAYIPFWTVRKWLYRILGMKIGKGSRIAMRVYVYAPWRVRIGEHTMINSFAFLDGRGGLTIGANTSISVRSVIYTASHKTYTDDFEYYKKSTTIGNCCWIGVNAVVLAGTVLADRTVVGANSVIKGKTRGGTYMGVPAVFVKERNLDKDYCLHWVRFFD